MKELSLWPRNLHKRILTNHRMLMIAMTEPRENCAPFELSADLSAEVGAETLRQIVSGTVERVPESWLRRAGLRGDPARAARVLLKLLTYCYAQGIYRSRQIERLIDTTGGAGDAPAAARNLVRRFRLKNREVLAHCLERVCWQVCKLRKAASPATSQIGEPLGSPELRVLQMQIACDINERLNRADRLDYWDLLEKSGAEIMERKTQELTAFTA